MPLTLPQRHSQRRVSRKGVALCNLSNVDDLPGRIAEIEGHGIGPVIDVKKETAIVDEGVVRSTLQ